MDSPKVGNIIKNRAGYWIITQVDQGVVNGTERLEDFIAKCTIVKDGEEFVTIQSVIEDRCDDYLNSGVEIISE